MIIHYQYSYYTEKLVRKFKTQSATLCMWSPLFTQNSIVRKYGMSAIVLCAVQNLLYINTHTHSNSDRMTPDGLCYAT